MTFSLTGRTVLLTGASKGIGAETAKTLLQMGAHVVAHYGSDRAGAEAAIADAAPGQAIALQADLGDQATRAASGRRLSPGAAGSMCLSITPPSFSTPRNRRAAGGMG